MQIIKIVNGKTEVKPLTPKEILELSLGKQNKE